MQAISPYLELSQPLLAFVRLLLAKRKLDELSVTFLRLGERDHMTPHIAEVLACILILARTQTLPWNQTKFSQGRLKWDGP